MGKIRKRGKYVIFAIDFMLAKNRGKAAAKAFFDKAIALHGLPEKVTMDKSGANKAGIDEINFQLILGYLFGLKLIQIIVRQIKYLNNIVEQDHRSIKKITKPMMGFKAFHSAEATISGIELHHMLRKEQHANTKNQSIFKQFYALAG